LLIVVATAFPVIMPVVLTQLVNGSILTTVLRLRAARRELAEKSQQEADADLQTIDTRPILTAVAA
jgi:CDP-diacylglycerol--glycerol-3-phosphate 3-phosphatidyltransferase